MLFLMGETVRKKCSSLGQRPCAICDREQSFFHVQEVNYFTFFAVPLLPISTVADYCQCEVCQTAYADENQSLPSHVDLVRIVTTYILTGYGMANQVRIIQEIGRKISESDFATTDIKAISRRLEVEDVMRKLEESSSTMNAFGKIKIIEAAFLSTHVCCEIQYEDRLRINLMGNALGVSIQIVEHAIQEVRRKKYYGVHRLLPTQSAT